LLFTRRGELPIQGRGVLVSLQGVVVLYRALIEHKPGRSVFHAVCLESSVSSRAPTLIECVQRLLLALNREVAYCRRMGLSSSAPVRNELWNRYRQARAIILDLDLNRAQCRGPFISRGQDEVVGPCDLDVRILTTQSSAGSETPNFRFPIERLH